MLANNLQQHTENDHPVKLLAKRSLLLLLSLLAKLIAQLAVILIYARKLSYQDYGNYQSAWLYINIFSIIALFGLPSLILSVSPKNITLWIKNNYPSFFTALFLLNIIPLSYIAFFCNQFDGSARILLIIMILSQNASIITETISIKAERERLVLISNIIFNAGYLACHLLVLYINYSLQLLLIILSAIYFAKAAFLFLYNYRLRISENGFINADVGKQWFYLGVNDAISIIAKWLDKWIILLFISVSQFALYFNGSYEIPVFALMLSAVGNIMVVEFSKHSTNNNQYVRALFNSSSLFLSSIIFPCFAFLLFYHLEFFTVIFSHKYIGAVPIFIISIFILPTRITYYTAVLQAQHKNALIVKGSIIDLIAAVILMFIFYPILQMKGLALAFVVSTYIQAGYYLWETSRLTKQKISAFFPIKKLILIMLSAIALSAAGYLLSMHSGLWLKLLTGAFTTILLISTLLFYFLKKDGLLHEDYKYLLKK